MRPLPPAARARLRARLKDWYRRHARPLPWRRDQDPYRVWVAEAMLQQTTVAAVLPRYESFLRRFPDVASLAQAPEAAVLKEWAGLGYYARARNLRAAARAVRAEHGGAFPREVDSLLALPGVGRYTAAAVASIAFGRPAAVLDGNVARVLCRLLALRLDPRSPAAQRRLQDEADRLLDRGRPGDWNQALMELGETVCVQGSPRCPDCPASGLCAARRAGLQDRLPVVGARPRPTALRWTCLWIEREGRVLLCRRGQDELILKGHWGLPEAGRVRARLGPRLKTVRHAITRYRIELTVRRASLRGPRPPGGRWVARARLRDLLVASLWTKALPD